MAALEEAYPADPAQVSEVVVTLKLIMLIFTGRVLPMELGPRMLKRTCYMSLYLLHLMFYAGARSPEYKRIASLQGDMLFQATRRYFLEVASKTQATYSFSKRCNIFTIYHVL